MIKALATVNLETHMVKVLNVSIVHFFSFIVFLLQSVETEDCLDRQTVSFAELISQRGSIWQFSSQRLRMQGEKP